MRPEKLWPFEWDKKNNTEPKMTKERLAYLQQRSKALNKDE